MTVSHVHTPLPPPPYSFLSPGSSPLYPSTPPPSTYPHGSLSTGSVEAEHHCGRVLGLHFHHSNPYILYAADCAFGLLQLNINSGEVEVLVPQGQRDGENPFINFGNDLVVLSNGSIFFTDSSRKFSRYDNILDVFEGRPNGQLLHYHPGEKRCYVAVAEMHFPNGICLSQDGGALLISETTRARIQRYCHIFSTVVDTCPNCVLNHPFPPLLDYSGSHPLPPPSLLQVSSHWSSGWVCGHIH